MKNKKGFTLIEVVISIALIAVIMGILFSAVAQTLNYYNKANVYKKESDAAFDTIQSDSSDIQYKTEYKLVTTDSSDKKESVRVRISNYSDNTSTNKLTYQGMDVKLGTKFTYNIVYTNKDHVNVSTRLNELNDYGVQTFEDLPDTNYSALKTMSDQWGDWSFVGWSTTLHTYSNTRNWHTYKYKNGEPKEASAPNWKGLITKNNFLDYKKAVDSGQITDVNLYATYIFSYDLDYDDDIKLLKETQESTRTTQDNKNLNKLAKYAASILKDKGTSVVDHCLDDNNCRSAIYEDGLEILHFRENGWPVEAATSCSIPDSRYIYYTRGVDLINILDPYLKYGKRYEMSNYYKNFPKIGDDSNYNGGFKGNDGFFYETFKNGIGYDLTKVGGPIVGRDQNGYTFWRGINYSYNCLLFGPEIMDDSNQFKYSIFMKIDKNSKNVTVWVNNVANNGTSDSTGINSSYSATASYA